MRRIAGILSALTLMASVALAAPVNWYSTHTSSGAENSAVVPVIANRVISLVAVENFNTSAAETAMCFDATSLPGNGAVPLMSIPLAAASSSTQPTPGSFGLPQDGYPVQSGFVCGCSTTAKTLTVDTTSGGVCFFQVGWNR